MLRYPQHVPLRFRHVFKLWLHSSGSAAAAVRLPQRRAAASAAALRRTAQPEVTHQHHDDIASHHITQSLSDASTSLRPVAAPASSVAEQSSATDKPIARRRGRAPRGTVKQVAKEPTSVLDADELQAWIASVVAESEQALTFPPLTPIAAYAATHNRPFIRLRTATTPANEQKTSLADWIRSHNSLWRDLTDDRLYSLATYASLAPFQQRKALKRLVYYVADQLQQQERRRYLSEVSASATNGATEQEQQLVRDTHHHQFMYIIDARKQMLIKLKQCVEPMQLVRYYCECVYEWLQRYVPRSLLQEVLQPPDQPMPARYRAEVEAAACEPIAADDNTGDTSYANEQVQLNAVLTKQHRAAAQQLLYCYDRNATYTSFYDFLEQHPEARELLAPHVLTGIQLQLLSAADVQQHVERLQSALYAYTHKRTLLATIELYNQLQQQHDASQGKIVRLRALRRVHIKQLESIEKADAVRRDEIKQYFREHDQSAAAMRQFYRYVISDKIRNLLTYWVPLPLMREWITRIRNDHSVGPAAALGLQNEPDTPVNLLVQWPMTGAGIYGDNKLDTIYDYATGRALFEHWSEIINQPRIDALRSILRNTAMQAHVFRRKIVQMIGNFESNYNVLQRIFLLDRRNAEDAEEQRMEAELYKDLSTTNRRKSWSMDFVALQQWFSRFVLNQATASKQLTVNDLVSLCHVPRGMSAYCYRLPSNRFIIVVYAISRQQMQAVTQTMQRLGRTMQLRSAVKYTGNNAFDYSQIEQQLRPTAIGGSTSESASTSDSKPQQPPPSADVRPAASSTQLSSMSHDYYTLPALDLMSPMPGAIAEYVNPSLADSVYDEDEDWCVIQVADNIEFHLFDSHDSDIAATQYTNDTDYMGGAECSMDEVSHALVSQLTMVLP